MHCTEAFNMHRELVPIVSVQQFYNCFPFEQLILVCCVKIVKNKMCWPPSTE